MWKFVTRGIRESLERRTCRTNVYSQSSQDGGGSASEQNKVALCDKKFMAPCFTAYYHGNSGDARHPGPKDEERRNNYDAKYSWSDAVGWSGVLAVGYVVCQSLCIRRKLFEIDNINLEKWRKKLIVSPQIQASRFLNYLLLPKPQYILPVSKEPTEFKDKTEILVDNASSIEQPYGPITAEDAFKEAVNEFVSTHEEIMGELEFNCGSKAMEDKRYKDAFEHFYTGAKLSSTASMFNLALCYELGLGTSADNQKALKYYKRAADNGHIDAIYNLGVYHAQGRGGLKINLDSARQLFTEAANKGHSQAEKALQLEKSLRKHTSPKHNNKHLLEVKNLNNNLDSNILSKLISYNNVLMTDLSNHKIESNQFTNSYDKNMSSTDMFLNMLGIHERSAIPLLSVGESGP